MPTNSNFNYSQFRRGLQAEWDGDDLGFLGNEDQIQAVVDLALKELKGPQGFGDQVIGHVVTGITFSLTLTFAECRIDTLAYLFPFFTLAGTTNKKMVIEVPDNIDLYDYALPLELKTLTGRLTVDTDENYWMNFLKAVPNPKNINAWSFTQNSLWTAEWFFYPDKTAGTTFMQLGYWGYATST